MLSKKRCFVSFISSLLIISFLLCSLTSCSNSKDITSDLKYDKELNIWYSDKNEYDSFVSTMKTQCSLSPVIEGVYILATDDDIIFIGGINSTETDGTTPVNAYTTYEIGSNTKMFTATAIFQLIEKGELSLDDTLDKFFPEYKHGKEITIYQVLHMQAGLRREFLNFTSLENEDDVNRFKKYYNDGYSDEELLAELFDADLEYTPGTKFLYSNAGYTLLAMIIEKITNISYAEYIQKNIFDICEMNNTTCGISGNLTSIPHPIPDEQFAPYKASDFFDTPYLSWINTSRGAGGINSCATDMISFDRALVNGKLINEDSLKEMFNLDIGYGCGWYGLNRAKNAFRHDGSTPAYASYNLYIQSEKYGNLYLIQLHPTYDDAEFAETCITNIYLNSQF